MHARRQPYRPFAAVMLAVAMLFVSLWGARAQENSADEAEPNAASRGQRQEVRLGDSVAFMIGASSNETAKARASAAENALKQSFETASPDDVRIERRGELSILYVKDTPVVQLSAADADQAAAASLDVFSDEVAASTRRAVKAEKERSDLANTIFSISLAVFLAVGVFYLRRRVSDLSERTNNWLEDNPHRIPEVRVRTLTLLTPAALRSGLALAISVGTWVAQLTLVYLWLIATLSFFESTRPYMGRLNALILQPFVGLASRLAGTLPIAVVVAIATLLVAILFRVVGLFFESVREGTTELEWMPAELARPTSTLLRASIVLVTMVFAAPILTGQPQGALARTGLFALAAIGLSAVPLLSCCVAGIVVVFSRRYSIGDHVRISGESGRVADVGLLDVTVETSNGSELRFPHLLALFRPSENLGPSPRVGCELVTRKATPGLREQLMTRAAEVGAEPKFEIVSLDVDSVTLRVSVLSETLDAHARLNEAVLEVLSLEVPGLVSAMPAESSAAP